MRRVGAARTVAEVPVRFPPGLPCIFGALWVWAKPPFGGRVSPRLFHPLPLRPCANAAFAAPAWQAPPQGSRRHNAGAGEITAAIEKLRGIIETHELRFLSLNNFDEVLEPRIPVRDLLGYRLGEGDALIWAFTESAWKETLQGVGDLRFIERELHRRGIIQVTPSQLQQRRFRFAKKIKGRSCRLAAVCAAMLFDEGDDPEQTSF